MDFAERQLLAARIAMAFSPGAPIDQPALFAGRTEQIMEVVNALIQRGQHVVLFGERGVGKTSLANILAELGKLTNKDVVASVRVNCDRADTFESIWRKLFRELTLAVEESGLGFAADTKKSVLTLDQMLPVNPTPEDVRFILDRFSRRSLLVIDEFDRVESEKTRALIADTIKTLSDHSSLATLVLVGVADSVNHLIREHESIERALVQIRMPRMSRVELLEVISKGMASLDLSIEDDAANEIVSLSQGLPHFTHLLALHAAQNAAYDDRRDIVSADVDKAVTKAVHKAQQSIVSLHHQATTSQRTDSIYEQVLLACALANTDELGYFAAADVRAPLSAIMGKPYDIPAYARHLNDFCEARGPVLEKKGIERRYRFRFLNPMMQPYVVMRGRSKGHTRRNY